MQLLDKKADYPALLQSGREWQKSHPADPVGVFTEANASYMLGEVDVSITAWEKLIAMDPASATQGAKWLKTARAVRRNFPDLQLKPLQFQPGDATVEQEKWKRKSVALLAAKQYDEIEKLAAQLQKSNAANAKGSPHLSFLLEGLLAEGETNFAALERRITSWRAARPKSNLARIAAVEMWTDAGWKARGGGFADTITPAMQKKIDAALVKAQRELKNLPQTAFQSPLSFIVALNWGRLAGQGRDFTDPLFAQGEAQFPNYLPLYRTAAIHLLPRWGGEPGESLAMIETRADEIGGADGDVFYARVIWHLVQSIGDSKRDFSYNYMRVARGLATLHGRFPNSTSVAGARLELAFRAKDWKTAQQILSAPNGHLLDSSWERWAVPQNQKNFFEQRMLILGESI